MEISPIHQNSLLQTPNSKHVGPTQATQNKVDKDVPEKERRQKQNRRRNRAKKKLVIDRRTSSERRGPELEVVV